MLILNHSQNIIKIANASLILMEKKTKMI